MADKTPHIAVLLSSYNGERFIEEQIQSILDQENVLITLFIRDDGSHDTTPSILQNLAKAHERIKLVTGSNLGVVRSFFTLLEQCGSPFDYYAFADQDDFWKPGKLSRAAGLLSDVDPKTPAMYYSRLEFTDQDLKTIGYSAIPANRGFHNAVVQNQATGCTIVINPAARDKILAALPDWALMHDWWIYLVVSAFGTTYYDHYAGILYRKHDKNVTPATPWFALELWARVKRYLGQNNIPQKVTDQVREFKRLHYRHLPHDKQAVIDGFLDARGSRFGKRFRYILSMSVRRNTASDNLILKILILFGKF